MGYIEIRPSRTMRRNEYDEQTVVRRLKGVTREDIERKKEREEEKKTPEKREDKERQEALASAKRAPPAVVQDWHLWA